MALDLAEKLASVVKKIGLKQAGLAFARSRHAHFHRIATKAYDAFERDTKEATKLRKAKKLKAAHALDKKATRASVRSENAAATAQKWTGHIKDFVQQIEDLAVTEKRLKERIQAVSGVTIRNNKVTGSDKRKCLQKAALASAAACAAGRRENFYSQLGAYDVSHCITGPPRGHRDDCSSWFASVYFSCGLPDPSKANYGSGYTGSLEAHGKRVSIEYAMNNAGCAILYGSPGRTHHVEFSIGDGTQHTIGHGSAPVDMGVFNLFGDGNFRCFKFPLS